MNVKERKRLYRIYAALNAVPGAHQGGGTMSVTVAGVASFANDMRKVRDHLGNALMALFDGAMDSETRDEMFEAAMESAEGYITGRAAAGWSTDGRVAATGGGNG